ncbi:glucosamine-6-phosphate deaminase [Paenibacillaceae bacterium]|nr:glucosamine-6-phosphate deaminase [Paenibacillaceae bacterium]
MNSRDIPVRSIQVSQMKVQVYADREAMGAAAGKAAAQHIRSLLAKQPGVRMVFAAAPSQNEFLDHLAGEEGIDWSRITVFHMDEYIGLREDAPQAFSRYLQERIWHKVNPGLVHLINPSSGIDEECSRYAALLTAAPLDIVCMGIGENGHLAFNDPPVADFNDPAVVKPVELDDACRTQQVNDGCFATFEDVPTHALTLTIPALMGAFALFCIVPGVRKREALQHAIDLKRPLATDCPATILRTHSGCTVFTDQAAFGSSL